jgi:hypothetical protein
MWKVASRFVLDCLRAVPAASGDGWIGSIDNVDCGGAQAKGNVL